MKVNTSESGLPVLAIVAGHALTELPTDLFIPPDALEVLLESFTGPLDLLLYLIRQQNIDILDIPIALITQQYMQYIDLMNVFQPPCDPEPQISIEEPLIRPTDTFSLFGRKGKNEEMNLRERRLELAADYLVMAALLAEIKSKLLLPKPPLQSDLIEEDPRMELVRRLQSYEKYKKLAIDIDHLPRYERDIFPAQVGTSQIALTMLKPDINLSALLDAMTTLLTRQNQMTPHHITRELLSVRERMTLILHRLKDEKLIEFNRLLNVEEGRMGLVVTLLGCLELARQSLIILTQTVAFSPIHIQANQNG